VVEPVVEDVIKKSVYPQLDEPELNGKEENEAEELDDLNGETKPDVNAAEEEEKEVEPLLSPAYEPTEPEPEEELDLKEDLNASGFVSPFERPASPTPPRDETEISTPEIEGDEEPAIPNSSEPKAASTSFPVVVEIASVVDVGQSALETLANVAQEAASLPSRSIFDLDDDDEDNNEKEEGDEKAGTDPAATVSSISLAFVLRSSQFS
jgi:hypothetical protein